MEELDREVLVEDLDREVLVEELDREGLEEVREDLVLEAAAIKEVSEVADQDREASVQRKADTDQNQV